MNADVINNEKRAMGDELSAKPLIIRYPVLIMGSLEFDLIGVHRRFRIIFEIAY
jgi:hypothetical protein